CPLRTTERVNPASFPRKDQPLVTSQRDHHHDDASGPQEASNQGATSGEQHTPNERQRDEVRQADDAPGGAAQDGMPPNEATLGERTLHDSEQPAVDPQATTNHGDSPYDPLQHGPSRAMESASDFVENLSLSGLMTGEELERIRQAI